MKQSGKLKFRPVVASLEGRRLLAAPITEFSIPAGARGIVAGPGDSLWFTLADDQIGRIAPDGQVTTFRIPPSKLGPEEIIAGPDGNVWFTYTFATSDDPGIGRITPEGQYTGFAPGTKEDLAAGPDGNVWFTDGTNNAIGRITPTGQVTEFSVPTAGACPWGITAGPDGNSWFTEYSSGKVGRITPDGSITEFPLPALSAPEDIAAGSDGNLWFTSVWGTIYRITTSGQYTQFSLPAAQNASFGSTRPNPDLADLAAGPDGDLWFTEFSGNAIGRITPAGVITEFATPTAGSGPMGIAAGPDGNIWFAEHQGAQVGRFRVSRTDLGVTISPQSATGTVGQGLTYTVTVTNFGPSDATDVVLTEDFVPTSSPSTGPQLAPSITATASQGTVKAVPFLAQLGSLPRCATATVTIHIASSGEYASTSRFAVHANESDTNPANDAGTLSVTIGKGLSTNPLTSSPHVLSLSSIRVKRKGLVAIVINFDQPMNPGRLQDLGIYHVVTVSPGKRARQKVVRLTSASYDAASASVRLSLKKPVNTGTLRLTIDHSGVLAANGIGLSGGDYVATVPK
jgi:uncharacterized repeat protein (TIGR01451 family)